MNILVVFDKVTNEIVGFCTSVDSISVADVYPNRPDLDGICLAKSDEFIQEFIKNYPHKMMQYEIVFTGGVMTDLKYYPQISVAVDKPQITADGIDAATITATVDDPSSTEDIEFYDAEGNLLQTVQAVNGKAQLPVTATSPGQIVITAKSTTKYGQRTITIEAVEV